MRDKSNIRRSLLAFTMLFTCSSAMATSELVIVKAEDVQWNPLNPARGDNSPQAGQLWGDRTHNGLSGFLVKFKDGFSSPPHIHNVGYRGVVISGQIHNDDPRAADLWMSPGSFWTQPAGESHITSAKGDKNIAYIEIDKGPYLVWPAIKAFDNGVRPVNVEASNIVWQSTLNIKGMLSEDSTQIEAYPEVAFVWGKPNIGSEHGILLRMPQIENRVDFVFSGEFRGIIIAGELAIDSKDTQVQLNTGSYFGNSSGRKVTISSAAQNTIIYVKTDGELKLSF